ncbi:MAG: hypothetical protein Q8K78_18815 [Planctomycetaceae bacterium]|nr:hypothetical protein [Planctomycetaceae bacterium]
MNTIVEIETAIERLPPSEVAELAVWLEEFCRQRIPTTPVEAWLSQARGAALPGVTTEDVMALTRDE